MSRWGSGDGGPLGRVAIVQAGYGSTSFTRVADNQQCFRHGAGPVQATGADTGPHCKLARCPASPLSVTLAQPCFLAAINVTPGCSGMQINWWCCRSTAVCSTTSW